MPAGTEGGGNKPQSGYGLQAKIWTRDFHIMKQALLPSMP
jgi:hypothetical protein